jgi:hypothetical protein
VVTFTLVPCPGETVPRAGENIVAPETLVADHRNGSEDEPFSLTVTWHTQVLAVGFGRLHSGPSPGAPMNVGVTLSTDKLASAGRAEVIATARAARSIAADMTFRTLKRTRHPS